jgi:hypothetical protein
MAKKPYNERTDLQKIKSQWVKISGLHSERQFSAAMVRCATAAEIAANLAIRKEFKRQSNLAANTVDSFLVWANGLSGKMNRLLLPLRFNCNRRDSDFKILNDQAERINRQRNAIVHSGEFANKEKALEHMKLAKLFIEKLVRFYEPAFRLGKKKKNKPSHKR